MSFKDLPKFLSMEREKLFKAKDYLISYYFQVITSLEGLRNHLFPYAFSNDKEWKNGVNSKSTRISVPDLIPKNIHDDALFNSNTLIAVINNLYAIQNSYLSDPHVIDIMDIRVIRTAHTFLLAFLTEQFSTPSVNLLAKQQKELAFALKQSIEDRIEKNITPFFDRLEMILSDEYIVTLFNPARIIIGTYARYKEEPDMFDDLLRRKCQELGLKNNPELNLIIIADLEKNEHQLAGEMTLKYEIQEKKTAFGKAYRLKEIALRYCTQHENLLAIAEFLREARQVLLHGSFFRRLFYFLKNIFTGKDSMFGGGDIHFSYLTQHGKIERKKVSLKELVLTVTLYDEHLVKFRELLDMHSYTKSVNPQLYSEIEKFVDTSYSELNEIFEKSNGFREWIGREKNRTVLKFIPERRQTDFSSNLLLINRAIIINRYSLQDFEKYTEGVQGPL
ncbi:MAG: hypothetical protein EHM28_00945 [Spirochaetaceae bacterium]|nr:MAG: hypothetical protein EHM28_00945 [Spirochaetaceae bacterium]